MLLLRYIGDLQTAVIAQNNGAQYFMEIVLLNKKSLC